MSKKTRRDFLRDAAKASFAAAAGISVATLDIKFDFKNSISVSKEKLAPVGMAEANAQCGMGSGCAGGGGQCGMGSGCAGGGGQCGMGSGCAGGGGQCGMGSGCAGGGGQCGMGAGCSGS